MEKFDDCAELLDKYHLESNPFNCTQSMDRLEYISQTDCFGHFGSIKLGSARLLSTFGGHSTVHF